MKNIYIFTYEKYKYTLAVRKQTDLNMTTVVNIPTNVPPFSNRTPFTKVTKLMHEPVLMRKQHKHLKAP